MVIVKISGGLGNQLFQYSFGRALSIRLDVVLKLDIQTQHSFSGFTSRALGLSSYNLDFSTAEESEIAKFRHFNSGILSRIERKLTLNVPWLNKHYVVENQNIHNKDLLNYSDNCYYDGYWQSEKYFKDYEDLIRKELSMKVSLDHKNRESLNEIESTDSISIHIRRGDYLSVKAHRKLFAKCNLDYYYKAIKIMDSKYSNPIYFVFSDDIEWASAHLKGDRFRYIDFNAKNPGYDLHLMSHCKSNIIANSTFSWWGAWLNDNQEKKVISPATWYNGSLNKSMKDLIPTKWIVI